MLFINIIIPTLTICIDSFLLCFTNKSKNKSAYFYTPIIFSFFQTIFLLLGYFLGDIIEIYLRNYIRYIIFIMFSSMGLKLVTDTLINKGKEKNYYFTLKTIFLQAIITSLDSIFLGIPFALKNICITTLIFTISSTTLLACFTGLILRNKLKETHDEKINLIGAFILFLFALKSLI